MTYEFNAYDYTILIFVLLFSMLIGLYHGIKYQFPVLMQRIRLNIFNKRSKESEKKQDETELKEYLVANSSMGAIPIALSLLASFFSAIGLLGMPAEVYEFGIEYNMIVFGLMVTPIIGAFLTGPLFARLKLLSAFEYLKLRFQSQMLHKILVICYIIRCLVYTSIGMYGAATTLSVLTQLGNTSAILIIGIVATFYTTIGGIKAVIWTDVFQIIIMLIGVIVIIIKGTIDIGGIGKLIEINSKGGRFNFFDFNLNPFIRQTFWSLFFGGITQFGIPYCIDQIMVQRFQAAKDTKTAQLALLLNVPATFIYVSLLCVMGLVLYATYHNCDPISHPKITGVKNPNQLLTYFVTTQLIVIKGMTGLFLSTILSGSLSTISSGLNSLSAIAWADILKNMSYFSMFNDRKTTITVKLVVLILGILCILISLIVSTLAGNLVQINILLVGSFNAPILGLFILGCVFPFTNIYGAVIGSISGFLFGLWLSYGSYVMKPLYPKLVVGVECTNSTFEVSYNSTVKLSEVYNYRSSREVINLTGFNKIYATSYMTIPFFATLFVIIVGVIVSLLTGGLKQKIDVSLLIFKSSKRHGFKSTNNLKENSTVENLSLYNF